jgi:hypothetical protein
MRHCSRRCGVFPKPSPPLKRIGASIQRPLSQLRLSAAPGTGHVNSVIDDEGSGQPRVDVAGSQAPISVETTMRGFFPRRSNP